MKKLEVPDITKELEAMYRRIDKRIAKYGELTQDEVEKEIKQYRREKANSETKKKGKGKMRDKSPSFNL